MAARVVTQTAVFIVRSMSVASEKDQFDTISVQSYRQHQYLVADAVETLWACLSLFVAVYDRGHVPDGYSPRVRMFRGRKRDSLR